MALNTSIFKSSLLVLHLICGLVKSPSLCAQSIDSAKMERNFGGAAGVTNNGISLLPTFSLNQPAGFVMLNMGNRLSFDPEFHFSLEGKPWTVLLWLRYKLIRNEKFKLTVGAHPGLLFVPQNLMINGQPRDVITTERYLASELAPNYFITPHTSIGFYYLRGMGFAESAVQNTNFLTFNANFRKIALYENFYLRLNPQVYYLKMDELDGFFASSTLTLAKKDFPLSFQMLANKSISTKIPDISALLWSLSLIYSFGNTYVPSPRLFPN
ncbi:hypothetical protein P872_20310 [Rhodonellum psychrophilum GCM71 = DSM 17998]|uniref:Outer membrane protein beta-barrel domain-containing protein n=2 Tax=Rhodonellum TaxID=336827 RepID=U5BTD8_9BACT|nr:MULTISPECIES: hypothetical protein [Rhodonellum]ERM81183.1 hypothetical protein P872_20310 [Rhodonellum psychrophilum GCM71 = DSM 17998]SDZ23202.1 hypothetical protein SAMN05444412_10829 [Rhodonellum ikkaensis]